MCKWKDKRDVYVITNKRQVDMVKVVNKRGEERMKPNIVTDYNNHMSGVDRSDQLMSYHSSLRKVTKWYKKVGVRVLELLLYNSYKMYTKVTGKVMKEIVFRETIIRSLIGELPFADSSTLSPFHYLVPIPRTEKKEKPNTRMQELFKKWSQRNQV